MSMELSDDPCRRTVDRRPDARIVRSALDEVKAIQTLLSDVYKDAGDGRTLLRELVQNADDAGAERLVFGVFDRGWPQAPNSLLRGPALLVANDGPFFAKHRDALHLALGGSKADDTGKVGRFGVGLKSVFHICEALVYLGADEGILRPGALNPWAGTGEEGDADPIHPDWDGRRRRLETPRRVANLNCSESSITASFSGFRSVAVSTSIEHRTGHTAWAKSARPGTNRCVVWPICVASSSARAVRTYSFD